MKCDNLIRLIQRCTVTLYLTFTSWQYQNCFAQRSVSVSKCEMWFLNTTFSILSMILWRSNCCLQAQDVLEDCQKINPVSCDNIDLVNDISDELAEQGSRNAQAKELRAILRNLHFRVWFDDCYSIFVFFLTVENKASKTKRISRRLMIICYVLKPEKYSTSHAPDMSLDTFRNKLKTFLFNA